MILILFVRMIREIEYLRIRQEQRNIFPLRGQTMNNVGGIDLWVPGAK